MAFVPTRDFVRRAEDSPNPGHGHHEFGNAETYVLVGGALGKAMVGLIAPSKKPADPEKPTSHTARKVEGWTVRIDDRKSGRGEKALEIHALMASIWETPGKSGREGK